MFVAGSSNDIFIDDNFSVDSTVKNISSDNSNFLNLNYKEYFYNLVKSSCFNSNMAIKQLMLPANTFGVKNDHDLYCKDKLESKILKSLNLEGLTDEVIQTIEEKTLLQSKSEDWRDCRKVRITVSNFYPVCKDLNEKQCKKVAKSILKSESFSSKYTI